MEVFKSRLSQLKGDNYMSIEPLSGHSLPLDVVMVPVLKEKPQKIS